MIRSQSIHSNRHAPSRDIAIGFAHCNRIRHLVSGGWVESQDESHTNRIPRKENLRQVGVGPQTLIQPSGTRHNHVGKLLGLREQLTRIPGQ